MQTASILILEYNLYHKYCAEGISRHKYEIETNLSTVTEEIFSFSDNITP
jgi:hypothetical protein